MALTDEEKLIAGLGIALVYCYCKDGFKWPKLKLPKIGCDEVCEKNKRNCKDKSCEDKSCEDESCEDKSCEDESCEDESCEKDKKHEDNHDHNDDDDDHKH